MSASIYLDNHSAAKMCQPASDAMKRGFDDAWGASYSPHRMGQNVRDCLKRPIDSLHSFVSADKTDQFAFAPGGAEAVQQVLWSIYFEICRKEGKTHLIVGALEDAPLMAGLKRLETLGCTIKIAPVDSQGRIDVERLAGLINPRTALVTLSVAQGLTGVVQPIEEVLSLCREKQVLLHLDASYAAGKIDLKFESDYLTIVGDKIHGPKSSAFIFAKKGLPLSSAGKIDVDAAALMALGAAADQARLFLDAMGLEVVRLRDRFEEGVLQQVPEAKVLFADSFRLPNVSVISFPRIHQEALLYALDQRKVYASIGGGIHPHLRQQLLASGVDPKISSSAISFALSRHTTEAEIASAVEKIADAVAFLSQAGTLI